MVGNTGFIHWLLRILHQTRKRGSHPSQPWTYQASGLGADGAGCCAACGIHSLHSSIPLPTTLPSPWPTRRKRANQSMDFEGVLAVLENRWGEQEEMMLQGERLKREAPWQLMDPCRRFYEGTATTCTQSSKSSYRPSCLTLRKRCNRTVMQFKMLKMLLYLVLGVSWYSLYPPFLLINKHVFSTIVHLCILYHHIDVAW